MSGNEKEIKEFWAGFSKEPPVGVGKRIKEITTRMTAEALE